MKITLFSLNDIHTQKIKEFLSKNEIILKEMSIQSARMEKSYLEITGSRSRHIIGKYQELALIQLFKHINKYSPKISV